MKFSDTFDRGFENCFCDHSTFRQGTRAEIDGAEGELVSRPTLKRVALCSHEVVTFMQFSYELLCLSTDGQTISSPYANGHGGLPFRATWLYSTLDVDSRSALSV